MSDFTPTHEQLAIIQAAKETQDNLLVTALAGAAKTSTLVLIAEALPGTQILCLAFNKKIQLEMQDRLPSNCTSLTLNGLGHRTWAQAIAPNLSVDARKCGELLKLLIDDLGAKDKNYAWGNFGDLIKSIGFGKNCGYIPTGEYAQAKALMDDDEFFAHMEYEPNDLDKHLIRGVSCLSLKKAWKGQIDFDDQILMPTVFHGQFPQYPLILIDEAQDLSSLNHAMLKKMVKNNRVIAVGDKNQAIYGFRGAHQESMDLLQDEFNMKELGLSISFRCPINIVEEARWRAPIMKWCVNAIDGKITNLYEWGIDDIPDEAAIICRNNAPLFTIAIKLLKNGRYPELTGRDIGKGLIRILKKLGHEDSPQALVLEKITEWEEAKVKKSRNKGKIHDQAECLSIFAKQGDTLKLTIAYAEHLIQQSGTIKLMTGHKSKGLEFNYVFILDRHLIRMDEGQDNNLLYVMQTRAMKELTYMRTEDFAETLEEGNELGVERHGTMQQG